MRGCDVASSSTVLIHIVTWNSAACIGACLEILAEVIEALKEFRIVVQVTDNASNDDTVRVIKASALYRIRGRDLNGVEDLNGAKDREVVIDSLVTGAEANESTNSLSGSTTVLYLNENRYNLGFAAAQNQGVTFFCESDFKYLLLLNPDLGLDSNGLRALIELMDTHKEYGYATGKLLRANSDLRAMTPSVIDSTGIIFDSALRHFDRGGDQLDQGQFSHQEDIEGASGACVILRKNFVKAVSFRAEYDEDLEIVFSQLAKGRESRIQLFDEAFFAYREDADLAWRARLLGWRCGYSPVLVGAHVRKVTQHRRATLDREINCAGVRNRFLLQINNFSFKRDWRSILPGLIFRNMVVLLGVCLVERDSLPAFKQVALLRRRAIARRRFLWELANKARSNQDLTAVS